MPAIYKGGIPYTGDTEAKYVGVSMPDSTLNMQELTENLLGDMATVEKQRAQAVHDTGDFLVLDGQLYKCTTSIAVGDRLAVGTNIAKTNAGSELGSLKGEIAALNSSLTVTEEYLPFTYGNKSVNIYFRKSGKMITVLMAKDNESMALPTSWTAVGNLTNIKPPSDRYIPFVSSNGYTGVIRIYSDGGVRILGHSTNPMWLQCSATTIL